MKKLIGLVVALSLIGCGTALAAVAKSKFDSLSWTSSAANPYQYSISGVGPTYGQSANIQIYNQPQYMNPNQQSPVVVTWNGTPVCNGNIAVGSACSFSESESGVIKITPTNTQNTASGMIQVTISP